MHNANTELNPTPTKHKGHSQLTLYKKLLKHDCSNYSLTHDHDINQVTRRGCINNKFIVQHVNAMNL